MRRTVTLSAFLCLASPAIAFEGARSFMPDNDLHLEPSVVGGITKEQFNAVLDRAQEIYGPIVSTFGAKLTIDRRWNDNTVNASADQPSETNWRIHMYGGLARRAEVTEDGFAMVVCHELGHHLAGFPFVESWAANEGQSDLFATGACAFRLFATNFVLSAQAIAELPDSIKAKCDNSHADENRDNCYRAMQAGKSLGDLLAALNGDTVNFDTPDTRVVRRTRHTHPAAQCRLDTYIAGAVCGNSKWDYALIPGKDINNRNSRQAQEQAFAHSCTEGGGARPRCWFAPIGGSSGGGGDVPAECPYGNQTICDILCTFDPRKPWCNQ